MEFPRLTFECEYDERLASEAESRGHLGGVTVELADGSKHRFFSKIMFACPKTWKRRSDVAGLVVAEKGMIVARVTLENMQRPVKELEKEGFFCSRSTLGLSEVCPLDLRCSMASTPSSPAESARGLAHSMILRNFGPCKASGTEAAVSLSPLFSDVPSLRDGINI
jgi:hypothetical protein